MKHKQALPERSEFWTGRPGQTVGALFACLIGFLTVSQLVVQLAPETVPSPIDLAEQKLRDIERAGGRFDYVFIGSSQTFRAVDPRIVDEAAAELGCTIRSYNLGVPGLSWVEQADFLERVGSLGIEIDTIFIEPYTVAGNTLDQFLSDRKRSRYRPGLIGTLYLDQVTSHIPLARKVSNLVYLTFGIVYERSGVGHLRPALFPPEPQPAGPAIVTHSGFRSMDEETAGEFKTRRRTFLEMRESFLRDIEKLRSEPEADGEGEGRAALVLPVLERIRVLGSRPAVIFIPRLRQVSPARGLERRLREKLPPDVRIVNLNRPERYPELFVPDAWADIAHLGARGAERFSRPLGHRLCSAAGD